MSDYFRTSNNMLIFDETKNIKEVLFHHYISRKVIENCGNCDLPKGKFRLCKSTASKELNISRKTVDRIIKTFIELDIIREERREKGRVIYSYTTYLKGKE